MMNDERKTKRGKDMKYLWMTVLMGVFVVGCGGEKETAAANHDGHNHTAMEKTVAPADGEKLIYYTCPMESHKHIHSSEPGTCSECNMTLVPGVITTEDKMEYYGCPMLIHSHVRQDSSGRCAECKMELKPMRLKKA